MIKQFKRLDEFRNNKQFYWKYFSETVPTKIEQWQPEQIKDFQLDAVQDLFKYVMQNSPFYKEKFSDFENMEINTLADFSKLPTTTKEELIDQSEDFLCCSEGDLAQVHVSTGTTGGKPIFNYYSFDDLFLADLLPEYTELIPVESNDRVLIALPYEMSSSGLSFHRLFQTQKEACVLPVGKGGAYSTAEKTLEFLYNLNPTCVVTTPSYAIYLAELALQNDFDISTKSHIKYMWLTGEGCSDSLRKRIEKLWGASARFFYGSMEAGQIGIECGSQKLYHITSMHCLVEIIDENTGLPVNDGEIGEIVVTPLLLRGAPLIRYRTKDRGQIVNDQCCSEVKLPLLKIFGRKQEQIFNKFSPFFIEQILLSYPEVGNWYQLIENEDNLQIEFESSEDQDCNAEKTEEIRQKFEEILKIKCFVIVVPSKSLDRPTTKLVRVKRMRG
jgi:phenylacetate-CoA ligase